MLAVCTGCGLLLDAVAGWRLPGPLLPLSGLAFAIVALSFTTNSTTTAEASAPLLAVLALAGFGLGRARMRQLWSERRAFEGWALTVGILVFALCAAPVVMSGNATFLGYYILNDSSFHLGLANLYVGHGPKTTDLPQDGYTALVGSYIVTDYPTGGSPPFPGAACRWPRSSWYCCGASAHRFGASPRRASSPSSTGGRCASGR